MWRDEALCRGLPSHLFFDPAHAEEATILCKNCTVQVKCLEFAVTTNSFGVWGGTSGSDRGSVDPAPDGATAPRAAVQLRTIVFQVTHEGLSQH